MKNNALAYSLKVWLTAVVLGAFIQGVIGLVSDHKMPEPVNGLIFYIIVASIYGLIFSLPSFILLLASVWALQRYMPHKVHKKEWLSAISVLLTALCFIFPIVLWKTNLLFLVKTMIPYITTIVAGIWFYKLNTEKDEIDPKVSS